MSSLSANVMSLLGGACSAVTQLTKSHPKSNISLQLEIRVLIAKLDDLLLLENAELYHSSWKKLKIKVTQLTAERIINIDNQHIKKLIQTVEVLMINQKKLMSVVLIIYVIVLKSIFIWSDLLTVCEISICLVRELMITCSDVFSQDWECLIKQIMKKINKLKNSTMSEKILTIQKLSNSDVFIIMNTAEIKKQLKHSKSWLLTVSQTAKINYHKFIILMHRVCMFTLDCSKQNTAIKKLSNQNQHLQNRIKFLHIY